MIQIIVNSILGIAINPNIQYGQMGVIEKCLPRGARTAFVDLALTGNILRLFKHLIKREHWISLFIDHHFDSFDRGMCYRVSDIRRELGIDHARIFTRHERQNCTSLVQRGEWHDIDVVFFDQDLDGYLAFLRGCGVEYQGMLEDAVIFDGRTGVQSDIGRVLADAVHIVPPFFIVDPVGHAESKQWVFQAFADAALSEFKNDGWKMFVRVVKDAVEETAQQTTAVLELMEVVADNLVCADVREVVRTGKKIDFSTLIARTRDLYGQVLVATIALGHMGEQVFVAAPRSWKDIDLRKYLPSGVRGRLTHRVQVPLDRWSEFLENWQRK